MAVTALTINANALHVPLADASVQCIATSPPYYGLRDYGLPPTIWGGEPECEHVWGDAGRFDPRKASETNSAKQRSNRGTAMADEDGTTQQFCQLCGAWRGCLGLEPTPDCGRPFAELRDDLTDKERAYVISELERLGLLGITPKECEGQQ